MFLVFFISTLHAVGLLMMKCFSILIVWLFVYMFFKITHDNIMVMSRNKLTKMKYY